MTPEEFAARMREIMQGGDKEIEHEVADSLMCDVLRNLGYEDGVAIFESADRWYA